MPMQWHHLQIVAKCDYDSSYDQSLTLWVQAYGREKAIAIAMIKSYTWSDNEIEFVRVLTTQHERPFDADVIRGEGYDDPVRSLPEAEAALLRVVATGDVRIDYVMEDEYRALEGRGLVRIKSGRIGPSDVWMRGLFVSLTDEGRELLGGKSDK